MEREDWAPYNPDAVADYLEELEEKTTTELVDEALGWLTTVRDKEWAIRRVTPLLEEIRARAERRMSE